MSIESNLLRIREAVAEAERRSGRGSGSVKLMAVSKLHPSEAVREAIRAGQFLFGENRVQEASDKFTDILGSTPAVVLHLIGSLQRNKVKQIVRLASCIQSVDRSELLLEINRQSEAAGRVMDVLFEYRTGEDSKSGYAAADELYRSLDLLENTGFVRCAGLMTIAPFTGDRTLVRKAFVTLRNVRDGCLRRYPSLDFSELSMGMSVDFDIAIEEGSTLVRVGTAIFGERP